jgi:copper transporter 1
MPPPPVPPRLKDSLAAPIHALPQHKAPNIFAPQQPSPDPSPSPAVVGAAAAVFAGQKVLMDHGATDHGATDHGDMDLASMRCTMNMLWNADTKGPCIVFRFLQLKGPWSTLAYMVLLAVLATAYEYLRLYAASHDRVVRARLVLGPTAAASCRSGAQPGSRASSPHGSPERRWGSLVVPRSQQLGRSALYVLNVAISFFLMLVIMTYNAQLIFAVLVGAFVGHFVFHRELSLEGDSAKGMACH